MARTPAIDQADSGGLRDERQIEAVTEIAPLIGKKNMSFCNACLWLCKILNLSQQSSEGGWTNMSDVIRNLIRKTVLMDWNDTHTLHEARNTIIRFCEAAKVVTRQEANPTLALFEAIIQSHHAFTVRHAIVESCETNTDKLCLASTSETHTQSSIRAMTQSTDGSAELDLDTATMNELLDAYFNGNFGSKACPRCGCTLSSRRVVVDKLPRLLVLSNIAWLAVRATLKPTTFEYRTSSHSSSGERRFASYKLRAVVKSQEKHVTVMTECQDLWYQYDSCEDGTAQVLGEAALQAAFASLTGFVSFVILEQISDEWLGWTEAEIDARHNEPDQWSDMSRAKKRRRVTKGTKSACR